MLARQLADLVHAGDDGRPFVFFGHSVGALLARATARALRTAGRQVPTALGISGCPAPHRTDYVQLFAPKLMSENLSVRSGCWTSWRHVAFDPATVAELAPPLLADVLLVFQYRHQSGPPFDGRMVLFAGSQGQLAPPHELAGWAELGREAEPTGTCARWHGCRANRSWPRNATWAAQRRSRRC